MFDQSSNEPTDWEERKDPVSEQDVEGSEGLQNPGEQHPRYVEDGPSIARKLRCFADHLEKQQGQFELQLVNHTEGWPEPDSKFVGVTLCVGPPESRVLRELLASKLSWLNPRGDAPV